MTRPSDDTRLAEQPRVSLMLPSLACSSHAASGAQPYFARILAAGKLSKVHIPSSAKAGAVTLAAASSNDTRIKVRIRTPFVRTRFRSIHRRLRTNGLAAILSHL